MNDNLTLYFVNNPQGKDGYRHQQMDNNFADLLKKLSKIQEKLPMTIELTPLRIAIVTARNAPSHMRVIKTLRHWGVYVDEAYFMGGLSKENVLKAFGAHIFFDDQEIHLDGSRKVVPCGKVLYKSNSPMKKYDQRIITEKLQEKEIEAKEVKESENI